MYPATALAAERQRRCRPKDDSCLTSKMFVFSSPVPRRPSLPLIPVPPDTPTGFSETVLIQAIVNPVWTPPVTVTTTLVTNSPLQPDTVTRLYEIEVQTSGTITLPGSSIDPDNSVVIKTFVDINGGQRLIELSPEALGRVNRTIGTIDFNVDASLEGIQILPDDKIVFRLVVDGILSPNNIAFGTNSSGTISLESD